VNRRAKGDGGLSWDAARERSVASATIGYEGPTLPHRGRPSPQPPTDATVRSITQGGRSWAR
jgi:hypothetical protein